MSAVWLNKLMKVVGINSEEDEYEYDDEVEQYDEEDNDMEEEIEEPMPRSRRSFSEIEDSSPYSSRNMQNKVIPMNTAVSSSKMVITQPNCYEDVADIARYFKEKKSVIVNLENANKEDARRIVDFLCGSTFMVDGTIQRVSSLIYLITPRNVEIQNDIEQNQNKQQKSSFSWLK